MDNVTEIESSIDTVKLLSSLVSPATCILRREGIPILLTSNYGKGKIFIDLTDWGIGYNNVYDNLRVVRNALVWLKGTTCEVFAVHDGYLCYVNVVTNSMISMFQFDEGAMKISFNVTGLLGMDQFANITIPVELLDGNFTEKIDNSPIDSDVIQNSTHSLLSLTYAHRNHRIEIIATTVIPEFPQGSIFMVFIVLVPLIAIFVKTRFTRKFRT